MRKEPISTLDLYLLTLLENLQKVMQSSDPNLLGELMAGWLDYTILSFTNPEQVFTDPRLTRLEQEYLLDLLSSGQPRVWAAVELWPGEHSDTRPQSRRLGLYGDHPRDGH